MTARSRLIWKGVLFGAAIRVYSPVSTRRLKSLNSFRIPRYGLTVELDLMDTGIVHPSCPCHVEVPGVDLDTPAPPSRRLGSDHRRSASEEQVEHDIPRPGTVFNPLQAKLDWLHRWMFF